MSYRNATNDGSPHLHGEDCKKRVWRGGAWNSKKSTLRPSIRRHLLAPARVDYIGFRVGRMLSPEKEAPVSDSSLVRAIKAGNSAFYRRDYVTAARLMRPIARMGNPRAQAVLGAILQTGGDGVEKNTKQSLIWLRRAAEQGNSTAQLIYGATLGIGEGFPIDLIGSAKWLILAARDGTRATRDSLNDLRGSLDQRFFKEGEYLAHKWVARDEVKNPYTAEELEALEPQSYEGVPSEEIWREALKRSDYVTAVRELRKYAVLGDAAAQAMLGSIYSDDKDGVKKNNEVALRWLTRGAEQGKGAAQYFLARFYLGGDGIEANPVESAKWLKIAIQNGYKGATNLYRDLAKTLTADEIQKAEDLADKWRAKPE